MSGLQHTSEQDQLAVAGTPVLALLVFYPVRIVKGMKIEIFTVQ